MDEVGRRQNIHALGAIAEAGSIASHTDLETLKGRITVVFTGNLTGHREKNDKAPISADKANNIAMNFFLAVEHKSNEGNVIQNEHEQAVHSNFYGGNTTFGYRINHNDQKIILYFTNTENRSEYESLMLDLDNEDLFGVSDNSEHKRYLQEAYQEGNSPQTSMPGFDESVTREDVEGFRPRSRSFDDRGSVIEHSDAKSIDWDDFTGVENAEEGAQSTNRDERSVVSDGSVRSDVSSFGLARPAQSPEVDSSDAADDSNASDASGLRRSSSDSFSDWEEGYNRQENREIGESILSQFREDESGKTIFTPLPDSVISPLLASLPGLESRDDSTVYNHAEKNYVRSMNKALGEKLEQKITYIQRIINNGIKAKELVATKKKGIWRAVRAAVDPEGAAKQSRKDAEAAYFKSKEGATSQSNLNYMSGLHKALVEYPKAVATMPDAKKILLEHSSPAQKKEMESLDAEIQIKAIAYAISEEGEGCHLQSSNPEIQAAYNQATEIAQDPQRSPLRRDSISSVGSDVAPEMSEDEIQSPESDQNVDSASFVEQPAKKPLQQRGFVKAAQSQTTTKGAALQSRASIQTRGAVAAAAAGKGPFGESSGGVIPEGVDDDEEVSSEGAEGALKSQSGYAATQSQGEMDDIRGRGEVPITGPPMMSAAEYKGSSAHHEARRRSASGHSQDLQDQLMQHGHEQRTRKTSAETFAEEQRKLGKQTSDANAAHHGRGADAAGDVQAGQAKEKRRDRLESHEAADGSDVDGHTRGRRHVEEAIYRGAAQRREKTDAFVIMLQERDKKSRLRREEREVSADPVASNPAPRGRADSIDARPPPKPVRGVSNAKLTAKRNKAATKITKMARGRLDRKEAAAAVKEAVQPKPEPLKKHAASRAISKAKAGAKSKVRRQAQATRRVNLQATAEARALKVAKTKADNAVKRAEAKVTRLKKQLATAISTEKEKNDLHYKEKKSATMNQWQVAKLKRGNKNDELEVAQKALETAKTNHTIARLEEL